MTYNPVRFYGPATLIPLPTNPVKVFANKGIIKNIMITNITSGLVKYSVYLAPVGTDAQTWNKIFPDQFVAERTTEIRDLSLVVNAGDRLYITGAIPESLIATVSGVEIV